MEKTPPFGYGHHSQAAERTTVSEHLSPAQIRSNQHQFFPEVVGSLLAEHEHPLPEIVTPLDVETVWRVPRSSQKKQRALGSFAPHFRVGVLPARRHRAVDCPAGKRVPMGPTWEQSRASSERPRSDPAACPRAGRSGPPLTSEQLVLLKAVFSRQSGGGG